MMIDRRMFGLGLASALLLPAGRARAASDEDLSRLILNGRLDDALPAADQALAEGRTSDILRLMAGALRFAHGDYPGASRSFDGKPASGFLSTIVSPGRYLMGGPLDVEVLRTHITGKQWKYLASMRAGEFVVGADQAEEILSADTEAYAERQAALERAFYDGFVLSVAGSPGRTRFLDDSAERARVQHLCTAHFIRAEFALAANNMTEARTSLDAAAALAHPELLEYHVARAERARLG